MSKRSNESDAEYKERKKAKKEKKKAKKEKKDKPPKQETNTETEGAATTAASDGPCWNSFSDAPFAKPIQQALHDAGFTEPSPIQARAWPVALTGKDLIAVAKTGSGKVSLCCINEEAHC